MALIKLSGGPLNGEEKEIESPEEITILLPGYSPIKNTISSKHGHVIEAKWSGDQAAEAAYTSFEERAEQAK